MQQAAIPLALEGADLQVSAPTGTGKTLAYLVPVVQRLLSHANPGQGTRALILLPTRELAQQVAAVVKLLTQFTRLQVVMLSGGEPINLQCDLLQGGADIVIATTGRLLEHVEQQSVDLVGLELLILDEADRLLDMGFSNDVLAITAATNPQRQTLLFSATMNNTGLPSMVAKVLREHPLRRERAQTAAGGVVTAI
ncbi:MAG: DEAD/DEAH box helicase [Halothiobacillaceae bacterium]|nr:MAG: DEAD/DEAH box helicase [Halothiobacillaceae bacterium]